MFNPILIPESPRSILGVSGRYFGATVRHNEAPQCFCRQRWISESRTFTEYHPKGFLRVEIRFDDDCRNGHNSFAITADASHPGARDIDAGGCLHDDIAKVFPELEPLIKWHLTSSDGPMHYLANTIYHAGDKDHNGLRLGETRQLRNGKTGQKCWQLVGVGPDGKEVPTYSLPKYQDSDECPELAYGLAWKPWVRVGEGKARDLDAARSCAVWPDATDEELTSDNLKALLLARHPALMAEFKKTMESIGMAWEPQQTTTEA